MNALDLAELHGIDSQAGKAVAREPDAMVLVVGLVAEADAILLHVGVPASVEDRGHRLRGVAREIEVRSDVEAGERLEMDFLDDEIRLFDTFRDLRLQIAPRGPRQQP